MLIGHPLSITKFSWCILLFFLNNFAYWHSSEQYVVSSKSIELEYKVLADTTVELLWFKSLFVELKLPIIALSFLLCDNLSVQNLACNHDLHFHSKHIELDQHFI